MTIQDSEILKYRGKYYFMDSYPLESLWGPTSSIKSKCDLIASTNWRGYIATWRIDISSVHSGEREAENRLVLCSISGARIDGQPVSHLDVLGIPYEKLRHESDEIHAYWFSGDIVCGRGRLLYSKPERTTKTLYSEMLRISVINGDIVSIGETTHTESHITNFFPEPVPVDENKLPWFFRKDVTQSFESQKNDARPLAARSPTSQGLRSQPHSAIGRLLSDGPGALSTSELQNISISIGAALEHFGETPDVELQRKEDVRTVFLATEEIFKIAQSAHEHIKRESASAKSFFRNIFGRATSNADLLNSAQFVQAGFTKTVSPLVTRYAHTWGPLKTSTVVDDATKNVFTLVRYLMILVNTLVERQELLSKSANNEPLAWKDFKVVQDRYEVARADCINARLQARNSMLSDTI